MGHPDFTGRPYKCNGDRLASRVEAPGKTCPWLKTKLHSSVHGWFAVWNIACSGLGKFYFSETQTHPQTPFVECIHPGCLLLAGWHSRFVILSCLVFKGVPGCRGAWLGCLLHICRRNPLNWGTGEEVPAKRYRRSGTGEAVPAKRYRRSGRPANR